MIWYDVNDYYIKFVHSWLYNKFYETFDKIIIIQIPWHFVSVMDVAVNGH